MKNNVVSERGLVPGGVPEPGGQDSLVSTSSPAVVSHLVQGERWRWHRYHG